MSPPQRVAAAPSVAPIGAPQVPVPPSVEQRDNRPPVPASREDDDAAIRRVVASYARAIETKDLSLFKAIKPNLTREDERRLQDAFRAVSSQHVELAVTSIDRHGDEATVGLKRHDTIDAGGRTQTVETAQTLRLSRTAAGWVIVAIR